MKRKIILLFLAVFLPLSAFTFLDIFYINKV